MVGLDIMTKFVVGGAVRDVLLGQKPKDIDFVWVGKTTKDMIDMGFQQVGASFPVFLDEDGNEHALARTERKTKPGYNGFEVEFDPSVTLEDDLQRRDLTINAMAVDAAFWDQFVKTRDPVFIIDPHHGAEDMKKKVLRHVSVAFAEDPLRVLRVARFNARLGHKWQVDENTQKLMRDLVESGEVDHLTTERVWQETSRAIMEDCPWVFFATLEDVGALQRVLGIPPHDPEEYDLRPDRFFLQYSAEMMMEEWQRWVSFFRSSRPFKVEPLIKRWGMPTDLQKRVMMAAHIFCVHDAFYQQEVVNASFITFRTFRLNQPENMKMFAEVIRTIALFDNLPLKCAAEMITAFKKAGAVQVSDTTLEGAEIGKDLDRQRKEIFVKYIYGHED